ncbi:MAG: 16S rRNA (guanine(527)-N(7))-methyltransferase RsmG [Andreesenia angusta]|nr:16S rRNA (guanine(527)-N(7))-methyltransferase RsmG [Andreesenia angusta]
MTNILRDGFEEMNIYYNEEILEKFSIYKRLLKEWNKKMNITAITDDKEIDIKHFLDSSAILNSNIIKYDDRIIDIGTGGGFPGVPIKILLPETKITLFDSLKKRLKFLDLVIEELDLKNIETVHGRAEEFGRKNDYRETYDIAVSRAVASLNTLSEYCLPFVKKEGYFIAMKGPDASDELKNAQNAIKKLGGNVEKIQDIHIPFSELDHKIIAIKKIRNTPKQYPRGGGNPKKKPL